MNLFYCLPLLCILLHVCEEFAWPGGFLDWYRQYRPDLAPSLTVRFVVIVNTLLILFALWLAVAGPTSPRGVSGWIVLAAALACNGVFHVRGTVLSRRYSPGLLTVVLLYLPLAVSGCWYFVVHGATPSRCCSPAPSGACTSFGPPGTIGGAPFPRDPFDQDLCPCSKLKICGPRFTPATAWCARSTT